MRPAQRIRQVQDAASKLHKTINNSTTAQLLQRTTPAAFTPDQAAQLMQCCSLLGQLQTALKNEDLPLQLRILNALLGDHAASNAGALAVWA
jgi:hypothetical protein